MVLVVSVVQADRAESAVSVVLGATGPRLYRRRLVLDKMDSETGRTTPYIVAAHLIRTGLLQIGLVAALAATHSPNARPAHGNKLLDRVEG